MIDTNAIGELQASFKTEGQPAFPTLETEKDTTAESPTEKTNIDQTQSQPGEEKTEGGVKQEDGDAKKDDNFANHPRWKEREEDWNKRFNDQEKRHVDEIEKLRQELQTKLSSKVEEKPAIETTDEVPAWFGGDEEDWKGFQEWNKGLLAQAEQRGADKAMKGIEEKSSAEQKAIQEATDYFRSELTAIETDKTINPNGEKVDQNKLLKFTLDNDLVDSKGRWNYRAAFKMMSAAKADTTTATTKEKKTIAAATMSEKSSDTKSGNVTTSDDFNKPGARPW